MRRELPLAVLGALVVAIVATWPTITHLGGTTVPGDIGDPLQQSWSLAWGGQALVHSPGSVYNANVFWPLTRSYAFTDTLLGYAPAGWIGSGWRAAVTRYDVVFIAADALAFLGSYLLARQLGTGRLAAAVAGAGFAVAPWRLAQVGHLNVLSTGGIPLALALLARGHAGLLRAGRDRPGWAVAGWITALWQLSLGFAIGLAFAYLLAAVVLVGVGIWWRRGRPRLHTGLVVADGVGALGFVGLGALLAAPYLAVVAAHPEVRRTVADVAFYSPPWQSLFLVPAGDLVWGGMQSTARAGLRWTPEMTLAPGATLLALAVLGALVGRWRWPGRVALATAAVVVAVLALGTTPAGGRFSYLLLFDYLPGWQGLRTSGRLVVYLSLALALLAAVGVDRLRGYLPRVGGPLAVLLFGCVVAEGLGTVVQAGVPAPPVDFATLPGPAYVATSEPLADTQVMLWSTDGFPDVGNGEATFEPLELQRLRQVAAALPSPASVRYLRDRGFATLVVPAPALGAAAGYAGQGLPVRDAGSALVVDLRRVPG